MTATEIHEIDIAAMSIDHIGPVLEIDAVSYPAPWSQALWERELADPTRTHLVALLDDVLVGHAGIMQVIDETHVTTVAVSPDHRGFGIASRLLVALLNTAMEAGSTAATLEVRAASRDAQRLYSRFGFVPAGVRRGYYSNPSDDAIIMWLSELGSDGFQRRLGSIQDQLESSVGQR